MMKNVFLKPRSRENRHHYEFSITEQQRSKHRATRKKLLITYVGKFFPDLADFTETLRVSTKRDAKFIWSQTEGRFTKMLTLSYFNPKSRTRLIADDSLVASSPIRE